MIDIVNKYLLLIIIQIWLYTMQHLYITARTYIRVSICMSVWLSTDHV